MPYAMIGYMVMKVIYIQHRTRLISVKGNINCLRKVMKRKTLELL